MLFAREEMISRAIAMAYSGFYWRIDTTIEVN